MYYIAVYENGEVASPVSDTEFNKTTKTLKPKAMKDYNLDLSEMGISDGTNHITYVKNAQGEFIGDVIVNLEKENDKGTYDTVERAVSSKSGIASFLTVIEAGDKAKYRYSVTESSEYVTPEHSQFKNIELKNQIAKVRRGKQIYYLRDYDTGINVFGETGDFNTIKKVFQTRIPKLTPKEYIAVLGDAEQWIELDIKSYNSAIAELKAMLEWSMKDPIVLKKLPEKKVSISKTNVKGKELEGATLELYKMIKTLQNGKVVEKEELLETWKTTGAKKEFSLETGSYVLKEKSAPKGYSLAKDISFTVGDEKITVNGKSLAKGNNTVVMVDNYDKQTKAGNGTSKDKTKDKNAATDTGDESNILIWAVLLLASVLTATGVIILGRRKKV